MARISTGDLDRRIIFQRAATVKDEFNEDVETWTDLAKVWARRRDVSDGEREAAGQVGATVVSRFVIRSTSQSRGFKATDRIAHDGAVWNISGIKQLDQGRDRYLEITATMDAD